MPSFSFFTCLLFLCLTASQAREHREQSPQQQLYHTVLVNSLFPEPSCKSSPSGDKEGASLEVVHIHGPCARHMSDNANDETPTASEILEGDEARVKSIRTRIKSGAGEDTVLGLAGRGKGTSIPVKSGSVVGSSNYMVRVGLGTPKKDLSLIFDTGSDFTWTQCQPCIRTCYKQQDPIFDPARSTTYSNVSCNSAACAGVISATSAAPGCSGDTCVYGIQYGDSSFSVGYFAAEKLTLTQNDVFSNFMFGCGESNQGLFRGTAGLLGLGRDKLSLVSQISGKFGKYFSYCLPSSPSSTGYLSFGKSRSITTSYAYTPLLTSSQGPSFYFLNMEGISVGGIKLSISPSAFSTAGTVIDSGTVITRLPPAAYSALRSAFRREMSRYPVASELSILDTCYDLSGNKTVTVPKIGIYFSGGAEMELAVAGVVFAQSASQVCLAFAGNGDGSDVGILGNVQQKTFNVVYDVDGGKLGFGAGGCA